jgi:hypothetical protein
MTTDLVAGVTRTRIIDWVRNWPLSNFESSSEPRSKTVKAPGVTGLGVGDGENRISAGDGEGTSTFCDVIFQAV